MRTLTLGILAAALGCGLAQAADLDYDMLRGAEYEPAAAPVIDWSGVYLGLHGGYTNAALGQRDAFQSRLADEFRNRDIETEFAVSKYLAMPSRNAGGGSYGVFAGYNVQFGEVVVGLEADYTHFGHGASSTSSIGRTMTTTGGMVETVDLDGRSATTINEYGSVRGRIGYAIGSLLPFVTGGLAVGQVQVNDTVSVQNYGYDGKTYAANQALTTGSPSYVSRHDYTSFNPKYPGPYSSPPTEDTQTAPAAARTLPAVVRAKTVGGAALGAGIEYALTPNILLRAEYQFVLFNDFDGHKAELSTVRGGAALKF